jgi:hypothetical protein
MECLLRKPAGSETSQPKTEAMWTAASKTLGTGLSKKFRVHILLCALDTRHRDKGLNGYSTGFCFALAPSLLSFFIILKNCLYIYSYVYTLFGPPPLCPPPPHFQSEPFLPSCPILLKRKHKR